MVTTVCLERLDRLRIITTGQRCKWGTKTLDIDKFQEVKKGVANYIGLNYTN